MALLLGTAPNQVPTNGDLGTSAFIDANALSIGGNAATVTTNANLTGAVTSVGNATTLSNAVVTSAKLSTDLQASTFGFKNRIINGDMRIDQRNAGASVTPIAATTTYTVDRFYAYGAQGSKFSVQQNAGAVTPPIGFINYLGVTSLSAYSVLSTDQFLIGERIEGFNAADFAWGTANAKAVTVSFQVYSSLTGTFGGAVNNSAFNRSYPFTFSVPVANTWTTIVVTISGDTTGTWLTTNEMFASLVINLGAGSTYSAAANAWSSGNYSAPTGATSVVGTSGATFYITGVQLEKGSTATSFDYRDYGRELIMCQRYYEVVTATGAVSYYVAGTQYGYSIQWSIQKRAVPTVVTTYSSGTVASSSTTTASGIIYVHSSTYFYPEVVKASAEL